LSPATKQRFIFWIETVIASMAALLAAITFVDRDWIEQLFGIDLDRHSGALEWEFAIALLLVAMLSAALARRQWNRALFGPAPKPSTKV
jgi:hypothetical protein